LITGVLIFDRRLSPFSQILNILYPSLWIEICWKT
jgi:hypothetical protein